MEKIYFLAFISQNKKLLLLIFILKTFLQIIINRQLPLDKTLPAFMESEFIIEVVTNFYLFYSDSNFISLFIHDLMLSINQTNLPNDILSSFMSCVVIKYNKSF